MENFEDVKKFFDYLIIDDDGWKGIRDDAPDSAKKPMRNISKRKKQTPKKASRRNAHNNSMIEAS